MFFYLSFLRPPPRSCSLGSEGVTITPQIANDLRTELLDDRSTDIYYVWQLLSPKPIRPTASQLLTTYAPPADTYKSCTIPLPKAAKVGQHWRLGLFTQPAETPDGKLPLVDGQIVGVWSESIEVTAPNAEAGPSKTKAKVPSKAKPVADKQTRITRAWSLPATSKRDAEGKAKNDTKQLRVVEQTSYDLDKVRRLFERSVIDLTDLPQKIWDSGLALSSWLIGDRSTSSDKVFQRLGLGGSDRRPRRILEIGAGTGLVTIALASSLARRSGEVKHELVTTDLPSAIPLIDENIALNKHLWSEKISLEASVLDWDESLDQSILVRDGRGLDVIIAADVTYNTASFPALIKILKALLQPISDVESPLLLLAYKQRDPGERELWKMAEDAGIKLEKLMDLEGHETTMKVMELSEDEQIEGTIELWVGSWSRTS